MVRNQNTFSFFQAAAEMQNFFSFNSHHQHQKQQSQGFSLQICSTILVNRQWDRLFSVLRLSPLSNLPPLLHTHMSLIYYRRHITLLCGNKCQLDATEILLQILLLAQHVSGTTLPIIRSSRVLYSGCCLWYFVLWFSS